jgi:hypothetical protein
MLYFIDYRYFCREEKAAQIFPFFHSSLSFKQEDLCNYETILSTYLEDGTDYPPC